MEQFTDDKICKYCFGCEENALATFQGKKTASCFKLAVDKNEFMEKYYGRKTNENKKRCI